MNESNSYIYACYATNDKRRLPASSLSLWIHVNIPAREIYVHFIIQISCLMMHNSRFPFIHIPGAVLISDRSRI